jgi:hypothetical protein
VVVVGAAVVVVVVGATVVVVVAGAAVVLVVVGTAVVVVVKVPAAVVDPQAASANMLAPETAIVRIRRWAWRIVERFGSMTLLFGSVRRGVEPAPGRQPERSS